MKLDDFINKTVLLELKDGSSIKGLLLNIEEKYDSEDDIKEYHLVMRINSTDYRLIDVNEVLTIGEYI